MATDFDTAAAAIVAAGQFIDRHGWAPAGSGNYSHRLDDSSIAITVSGAHKGRIGVDDIMRIDVRGRSLDGRKPSAETLLHTLVYQMFPGVSAVLHTHSIPAVVLTRLATDGQRIRLSGYELLKAFPGIETHDTAIDIPVFANSQDMAALSRHVELSLLQAHAPIFLIREHGLYGWGATMDEALRVVEAAETLLSCELELMKAARA